MRGDNFVNVEQEEASESSDRLAAQAQDQGAKASAARQEEKEASEVSAKDAGEGQEDEDSPSESPLASATDEGASVEDSILARREQYLLNQARDLERENSTQTHMTEDMLQPPQRTRQTDAASGTGAGTIKEDLPAWEPQTMAQKMRFFEAMENWKAMENASCAIQELSRSSGPHKDSIWDSAASWSLVIVQSGHAPFLKSFGFDAVNDEQWRTAPMDGGPVVKFTLTERESHAYHSWYLVDCELSNALCAGGESLKWRAPRRLCQLRWDLHDRVKLWMGETYSRHFRSTPFAKIGGPPGTLARLAAWLESLASVLNSGSGMPRMTALVLRFFQVPVPEGFILEEEQAEERADEPRPGDEEEDSAAYGL